MSGAKATSDTETVTIWGVVKDEQETLPSATLRITDTEGTITDLDGNFRLENVAATAMVTISFTGCTSQEKPASELQDATIVLNCNENDLAEVNVVEYSCDHVGRKEDTNQFKTNFTICEVEGCRNARECTGADMLTEHATAAQCVDAGRNGYKICQPTACETGYAVNSETKECAVHEGNNTGVTQTTPKATKKPEELKEAEDKYKKAKENEQSLKNRTLTAATTAATGIGMMKAAAAMSEQKADETAEQDMTAYLATFRCEYGKGQSAKAGNEEITLPGGNDLLKYYTEYKSLADNLKMTKKALGLRPGIEEEVLYDRAESGLYQYSSVGKTDGAYTSLSRALTDTEGKDADAWKTHKEKTAKELKSGLIAAGAGIVGGIAGNMAINGVNDTAGTDIEGLLSKKTTSRKSNKNKKSNSQPAEPQGQGTITANNKYGIDISKDGLNNVGYNLNGRCGSTLDSNSTVRDGKCSDLLTEKGTWWTSFARGTSSDYLIVYGTSKCEDGPLYEDMPNSIVTKCFCKATSIDDEITEGAEWVDVTNYSGSEDMQSACQNACATDCSHYLYSAKSYRERFFESVLKN